jgi:glycosyltransferase involved in cell wall biosynthesis
MDKTAVIVPAFNAGSTILELIERITQFVNKEDVIVVDDGSTDQTFDLAQPNGVVVLRHDKNRGKGEALKTGFDYVVNRDYNTVITIDADLQHSPDSIPDFMKKAAGFPGILIGTRKRNLKIMPMLRWLTNNLTSAIVSILSGTTIRDSQSGYRLIPVRVLKEVQLKFSKYEMESEILIKAARKGFPIGEVPIGTIYRGGKSFINPLVDTGRFIKLMWKSLWW